MTAPVRVPLPSSLLASYLVLAPIAGQDLELAISRRSAALSPAACEELAGHIGDLRVHDFASVSEAPIPPADLLRAYGASVKQCDDLAKVVAVWAVLLRRRPRAALSGESAARTAAILLAQELGGVVVDSAVPRLLLVDPEAAGPSPTSSWHSFDHVTGRVATDVSTRGLARFGIPELAVHDVPAVHVPAWDAILSGAAHLVLPRLQEVDDSLPDRDLELPAELRLTVREIAAAYGHSVEAGDSTLSRETELRLAYAGGSAEDRLISVTACGDAVADLFC